MTTAMTANKFLTDSEIKTLKSNLESERNKFHVLMVEFALYTGARSCEVLEVTTNDLSQGTVTIIGKKNSNNRTVPLPPVFFQKLQKHVAKLKSGEKLFNVSTRMFREVWKKVTPNRDKSLHCLRHTMGVKLYNNCENIHVVKTMLGHKNVNNTMVYLDFVEGGKKLKKSINGMWSNKLNHAA